MEPSQTLLRWTRAQDQIGQGPMEKPNTTLLLKDIAINDSVI